MMSKPLRSLVVGLGLLLTLASGASAQQTGQVTTSPSTSFSADASSTIAVTNTFQLVWSQPNGGTRPWRKGCLLINNSTNRQWVFFGLSTATPTKAAAIPLEPALATNALGGNVSCATQTGAVLQDQVWITGTAGDTFVAKQQ